MLNSRRSRPEFAKQIWQACKALRQKLPRRERQTTPKTRRKNEQNRYRQNSTRKRP